MTTEAGELQYFFGSQVDVTDRKDALVIKTMLLHTAAMPSSSAGRNASRPTAAATTRRLIMDHG